MNSPITKLYRLPKQIFRLNDLAMIWGERDRGNLYSKISYYVKSGALIRLTRGVFAKTNSYDSKELATSIYTPSYISFETALVEAGFIFQYYESIFVASPRSRKEEICGQTFVFRKLKDSLLYNPSGTIDKGSYSIAGPERAFLDTIYLFPDYYFDNLNSLDWGACRKLAKEFDNKSLIKRVERYYANYVK